MPLNNNDIKALKLGSVYKIDHQRKGVFIGQLIDFDDEPERLGDLQDQIFLKFKYDVRVGTAQENMAISPKIRVRVSNLRPSLIDKITKTEEDKWLLEIKVPEEEKAEKAKSIVNRFLRRS